MKYAATIALLGMFMVGCASGDGDPGNQALPDKNSESVDLGESAESTESSPESVKADRDAMYQAAWKYLETQYGKRGTDQRGLDSGWGPGSMSIAYTAIILNGMVNTLIWSDDEPKIKESVEWLLDTQNAQGFWSYMPDSENGGAMKGIRAVYITSIVVQLFSELQSHDAWKSSAKEMKQKSDRGRDYLKRAQVGAKESPLADYDKNSAGYGGWAYSEQELKSDRNKGKPASNMSTTTFAIDALHACGVDKSDPLWNRALVFLKRNQNSGETYDENFTAYAKIEVNGETKTMKIKPAKEGSVDYGGAIYSEETSKAGTAQPNADGTVTMYSYGTMTYNLLRSYLYSGLDKDSTPVQLALGWISKNYAVHKVPGYRDPEQYEMGLYYYLVSMSRTLNAMGVDLVEEPDRGLKYNWRADLVAELKSRQADDGSWLNTGHDRWQENSSVLCTAYALDALRHTQK